MTEQAMPAPLVIERIFDAPRDLIWKMWTEPTHFAAWYGPAGATIPVATMDVRVGGTRRVCMDVNTPKGPMRLWFGGEYREVVPMRRLVYTEFMANEAGELLAPEQLGMPAGHPAVTEVIVELEDLDDRTRMVMTHVGIAKDSPGAAGWNMAFEKLDRLIKTSTP